MFSERSSGGPRTQAEAIGLGFSLRLSVFYALIFLIGALTLMVFAYHYIGKDVRGREVDSIRDRLLEYRAWYEREGLPALRERFVEQSLLSPDPMFLRVVEGARDSLLVFSPQCEGLLIEEDVEALAPTESAFGVRMGRDSKQTWTVASLALTNTHVIQMGRSSPGGEKVLASMRTAYLLGVIPAIVIGIIGGTALAFHSMRPIRGLIRTIEGILLTGDFSRRATPRKGCHELNALVRQFNRLVERQERLIGAMHSSLDSVAHDLRTPMTRMRAAAEEALRNPDGDNAAREALADCLEESDHVLSLLTMLMELGEAQTGAMRLHYEEVVVSELLQQAATLYEFVAEDRGIVLNIEAERDLALWADRPRLVQLMANLIDNAIKYSPDGTDILIGGEAIDGRVKLWVKDPGEGIPDSEQSRIWERLYRGDRSRSKRGLGLGLSFVRAITEAHGGVVSVESTLGKGSTFTVVLPKAPLERKVLESAAGAA